MTRPPNPSLDAGYLSFFECFNRGQFHAAHDALEPLWLAERQGLNGAFYKGLIQLAGAFVHLERRCRGPAESLLRRARANLGPYRPVHEQLDVSGSLDLINGWLQRLERSSPEQSAVGVVDPPRLFLFPPD